MGRDVPAIIISHQDRRAYREKVRRCLDVLARMLRESRFDTSDNHVGLEMEFYLADDEGRAAPNNADVLSAIADEAWANELAQFNIELSVAPTVLTGEVFTALEGTIDAILAKAGERAATAGSRLVMVGILPSLREDDVGLHAISPNPRYKLLNDQILAARGEDLRIDIEGQEQLLAHVDHILLEAAGTSVQCHLQVSPGAFASYWNASQAIAGIQVAIAANSPYLFGRELWRET